MEECKVEDGEKWSLNDVLKWPARKELAPVQPAIVEKPVEDRPKRGRPKAQQSRDAGSVVIQH